MNQPTEITQAEYDKQAAWVEQFGKDFTKTVRISRAEYEELKQQRDELLQAMRNIYEKTDNYTGLVDRFEYIRIAAHNAIAKVTK